MAAAEFSKFAGILSAALSQHRLPGFEIAQLEFHLLHSVTAVAATKSLQSCPTLCDPMDGSHSLQRTLQAPLSMEFSRQESWSGLPFPARGSSPWF